jgi:hypothetical protein
MTPAILKERILEKLNIVASDFTGILTVLNIKKNDIASKISQSGGGHFGIYGYIDLVANQREYPLPENSIRVKAAMVSFDGSTWVRAKIRQMNDLRELTMSETDITSQYSNQTPVIFIFRQSLFVLSGTIINISDGIQLWYDVFPDDVPDIDEDSVDLSVALDPSTTVQIGFPVAFHDLLSRAVCLDFKETNEIPLTSYESNYDIELDKKIKEIEPINQDEILEVGIVSDDGSEY